MAVAGIVAEYNPFHRGHAWQIGEARRRLGEDTAVVAAMSGSFVQRGDFAVLSKHARAEMALLGGVDLVLEIPTPWAAAGAEAFALGGVSLLAATGVVSHLVFGAEKADTAALRTAAEVLEHPAYPELLRSQLSTGITFAAARQNAAERLTGRDCALLSQPNNNLAVEYLRALRALGSSIEPLALPRVGAGHDSGILEEYSSASALRREILAGGDVSGLLPGGTLEVLKRETEAGRGPVSMTGAEKLILSRLRMMGEEEFRPYDGGGEGLYHRFYAAVRAAASLEELLALAKTKRYPLARLRRMVLHSFLGLPPLEKGESPPYIRVLGANSRGRALLKTMRETASLPVITQPGEVRELGERAQKYFDLESRCTDQYVLAWPRVGAPDLEFRTRAVILKEESR